MDEIRIGVVGLGFGQHYVRTLANLDEFELVAVADSNPNVPGGLAAYADHYGARPCEDAIAMIAKEELDALSICTSPAWRTPIIEAAIAKDLALIIEKPWATNVTHIEELAALCRTAEAPVMGAFSFRYHPAIVQLRTLLDGELGKPWLLNGEYIFSWAPPSDSWLWDRENGNGYFNENSCHLFDAVCYTGCNMVSLDLRDYDTAKTGVHNHAIRSGSRRQYPRSRRRTWRQGRADLGRCAGQRRRDVGIGR